MPRTVIFAGGAYITLNSGPSFDGPLIENLMLVQGVAIFPRDYAPRWSGGVFTFSLVGGPVPGMALSAAGVLSGTPTTLGTTAGLIVRANDGTNNFDSNAFSIQIVLTLPDIQRAGFIANFARMMTR